MPVSRLSGIVSSYGATRLARIIITVLFVTRFVIEFWEAERGVRVVLVTLNRTLTSGKCKQLKTNATT